MAQMQYRTINNESPQGKPRVYFAHHPEDFQTCFEEIVREILDISNCAVYYYEDEPVVDEEYYLSLSQMQLIVMPVTDQLLCRPNTAMDVVFPYAVQKHIPVLPLMREQNLEQAFNTRFGDIQFLNKFQTDPTAIPYREKLKKYLESVLVGDDLARRVRAAFDSYIFLSYRKKDRKYAQELMRLIHRDEAYRNIAIWYDEFLAPGEDFNDSIRTALGKSQLFLLAVTPNLVNENNYVMAVEYPMAKAAAMPILPAEMISTDRGALQRCFPQLPMSVNPRKELELRSALSYVFRNIAGSSYKKDADHNYLIGLAYLSGIDVEVDHEYAVAFITAAAENGSLEAMGKLAAMYLRGEGVRRNNKASGDWLNRMTMEAEGRYRNSGTEEDAQVYASSLREFLDYLQEQRNLVGAIEESNRLTALGLELVSRDKSLEHIRFAAECFAIQGELLEDADDYEQSAKSYENAYILARGVAVQTGNGGDWSDVSDCCYRLGTVQMHRGGYRQAEKRYLEAAEIDGKLAAQSNTPEVWRWLANRFAIVAYDCEEISTHGAAVWKQKCAAILERLVSEQGEAEDVENLLRTYSYLGRLFAKAGDPQKSRDWYQKEADWWSEQVRLYQQAGRQEEAVRCCISAAKVYGRSGQTELEQQWLDEAANINERTASPKDSEAVLQAEATASRARGDACRKAGDLAGAEKWYDRAVAIREKLAKTNDTEKARADLSEEYYDIGKYFFEEGLLEQARKYLIKRTKMEEQLVNEASADVTVEFLARVYSDIGEICLKLGAGEEALEWYEKAFAIYRRLAEQLDSDYHRENLADLHMAVGIAYHEQGDYAQAESRFREAMNIRAALLKRDPTMNAWSEVRGCCRWLGENCKISGQPEVSVKWYKNALQISERIYEDDPSVLAIRDIARDNLSIADICEVLGDIDGACARLEQLPELNCILEEKRYAPEKDWSLDVIYRRLASLRRTEKNYQAARQWYYRLLEVCRKRSDKVPIIKNEYAVTEVYCLLGEVSLEMDLPDEAQNWYDEALKRRKELTCLYSASWLDRGTAETLEKLGDLAWKQHRYDRAKNCYESAIERFIKLAKEEDLNKDLEAVGRTAYKLGVLSRNPQMLRSAETLYRELQKRCPENEDYRNTVRTIKAEQDRYR